MNSGPVTNVKTRIPRTHRLPPGLSKSIMEGGSKAKCHAGHRYLPPRGPLDTKHSPALNLFRSFSRNLEEYRNLSPEKWLLVSHNLELAADRQLGCTRIENPSRDSAFQGSPCTCRPPWVCCRPQASLEHSSASICDSRVRLERIAVSILAFTEGVFGLPPSRAAVGGETGCGNYRCSNSRVGRVFRLDRSLTVGLAASMVFSAASLGYVIPLGRAGTTSSASTLSSATGPWRWRGSGG